MLHLYELWSDYELVFPCLTFPIFSFIRLSTFFWETFHFKDSGRALMCSDKYWAIDTIQSLRKVSWWRGSASSWRLGTHPMVFSKMERELFQGFYRKAFRGTICLLFCSLFTFTGGWKKLNFWKPAAFCQLLNCLSSSDSHLSVLHWQLYNLFKNQLGITDSGRLHAQPYCAFVNNNVSFQ